MHPVQWTRSALNDVADIWTRADPPRRVQITQAVLEVDQRLK